MISRKGLAEATMAEVAAEAGVSRATLYLYFKDRRQLVERTADLVISKLMAELQPVLCQPGTTEERLRLLVTRQVAFFHEHREFFRLFLETCGEGHRTRHRNQYQQHLDSLARCLQDGMDRGEVRPCDSLRLAVLVAEAIGGVVRRRLAESAPPAPETEAEWVATTLLRGLAAEGPKE